MPAQPSTLRYARNLCLLLPLLSACSETRDNDDATDAVSDVVSDAVVADVGADPDAGVQVDASADVWTDTSVSDANAEVDTRDVENDLDIGADSDGDAVPADAHTDAVGVERFEVVNISATDEGLLTKNAAFDLEFELPVSAALSWASATSGVCTGAIALVDIRSERCVGVQTQNTGERTLRLTPRQPLPLGASLELRVSDQVEGPNGEQVRPASASFDVVGFDAAPSARTILIDGENDFQEDERIGGGALDVYATWDDEHLFIGVAGADLSTTNQAVYVVLGARHDTESLGAAQVPSERWFEGSTTFLPFHASHLFFAKSIDGDAEHYQRRHDGVAWSERRDGVEQMQVVLGETFSELAIERSALGTSETLDVAVYVKDLASDCSGTCDPGWGWLYGSSDDFLNPGPGDRILTRFWRADLRHPEGVSGGAERARFGRANTRVEIYQLLVRTFGNTNETRRPDGTIEENGSGRFEHLNPAAAAAIAEMGMTHVWFTGALQQATSTDYSSIGEPADDPDILKGLAGSPYAIRDYFDLSPDYAADPALRSASFREALSAMHAEGLDVVIDFVPNHVARSYASTVRPELSFGLGDEDDVFQTRDNHFFYLQSGSPPLEMPGFDREEGTAMSPTCQALANAGGTYQCDGLYEWESGGETTFGRVTGNNVASWFPSLGSWYETAKLNYGLDYTTGEFEHPTTGSQAAPIPRTWLVMDEVITHWQAMGVDGFRVDMAHMVPMEFHAWLISRSRARNPSVFWVAEAYDTDPAKVTEGNVLHALLGAGYDAVYDDDTYDRLKEVFDGTGWANDVDGPLVADPMLTHHALRYAENHDEVRLASPHDWRFDGANVGRDQAQAITAMLFAIGRGPVMVYAGQETGEPAVGVEGFGGDDGRTSIFDYWSMPTFVGWVNDHAYDGGGLDDEIAARREEHLATWEMFRDPVFSEGRTYLLNSANANRNSFGRLEGETVSGRYAHALLRHVDGRAALVFVWLHPRLSAEDVSVRIPPAAWDLAGLGETAIAVLSSAEGDTSGAFATREELDTEGLRLGTVEPGGVRVVYLER